MQQMTPGSVKIYEALLTGKTNGAQVDITPQIVNFSIYESLYTPTIFCELLMEDAIDLWKNFPINGEEQIRLSFKSPGVDDVTTYEFDVFRVKDKQDNTTDKISIYILQCVSTESITAAKVGRVNVSYETSIEDIIGNLLKKTLNTNKNIFVEKTKGLVPILIPNLYTFQAIEFLKQRAVSAEVPNSSFVFFENQYGFSFRTIESLLFTKRDAVGSKEFTYDNTPIMADKNKQSNSYRNIIVLNKNNIADTTNNLNGGYANAVESFDIITKQTERVEYDFTKQASQVIASDKLATPFNTQEFFTDLKQTSKKVTTLFSSKDSSLKSDLRSLSLGKKMAYSKLFNNIDIDVLVYGDSTLTVGEPLKINTLNNSGMTGRNTDEAKISGTYLISSLRHLISPQSGAVYYTAMKLQKMGYSL